MVLARAYGDPTRYAADMHGSYWEGRPEAPGS
jgi:hypothetical protein